MIKSSASTASSGVTQTVTIAVPAGRTCVVDAIYASAVNVVHASLPVCFNILYVPQGTNTQFDNYGSSVTATTGQAMSSSLIFPDGGVRLVTSGGNATIVARIVTSTTAVVTGVSATSVACHVVYHFEAP